MGCKAVEKTCNIDNAFGPGAANERTVQWWYKKFCKDTRALMMSSAVVGHWKLTTTNWEQPLKQILLQLHKELLKNAISTTLWSFSIWNKLKRWKTSVNGCLVSGPQSKKSIILKLVFFYSMQQPFLDWIVTCNEEWILHDKWTGFWTKALYFNRQRGRILWWRSLCMIIIIKAMKIKSKKLWSQNWLFYLPLLRPHSQGQARWVMSGCDKVNPLALDRAPGSQTRSPDCLTCALQKGPPLLSTQFITSHFSLEIWPRCQLPHQTDPMVLPWG